MSGPNPPQSAASSRRTVALAAMLAALAAALTGAVSSLVLARGHGGAPLPWADLLCPEGVSGGGGCVEALRSAHGAVAGVPIAYLGLVYFGVMLYHVARLAGRRPGVLLIALCAAGALASAYWTGLMFSGAAPHCGWCMLTHAAQGVLLAALLMLWLSARGAAPGALWNESALAAAALAALCGVLYSSAGWRETQRTLDAARAQLERYFTSPAVNVALWKEQRVHAGLVKLAEDDRVLGPRDARPRFITYTDPACPACVRLGRRLRELRATEGGFSVVVRYYPRDGWCLGERRGPDPGPAGRFACDATLALEAAARLGGDEAFARLFDYLLDHHEAEPGPAALRDWADAAGADAARLAELMKSPEVRARIQRDHQSARELPRGTPKVLAEGRVLQGWSTPGTLEAVIAEMTGRLRPRPWDLRVSPGP